MKFGNVKGMSFGFSSVNAGQRGVTVEPQLIAVSSEGNFRITPPVSRVLGVSGSDYVMFINNIANIDEAITARTPEVVEFCEAQGLEVGSPEAAIALHKEFDMWAIAKGIMEYDAKGNYKTVSERLTKNDKLRFVSQHFDEMLTEVMTDGEEETKEAITRVGITKEEQMDILTQFVVPRELPKFKGSKTANAAGLTGTGVSLNFTDSNVWKQLKADMGSEATKLNRVFSIDIDELQDVVINNGYEDVTVKALILGEYTDKVPVRIGKTDEE